MSESNTYEDENGYLRFKDSNKYVHIWVMRKKLDRSLEKGEIIHHINGNRADNRNKNLLICDRKYHGWLEGKMANLYKNEHFGDIK